MLSGLAIVWVREVRRLALALGHPQGIAEGHHFVQLFLREEAGACVAGGREASELNESRLSAELPTLLSKLAFGVGQAAPLIGPQGGWLDPVVPGM